MIPDSTSSEAITRDVRVRVTSRYLPQRSDPARSAYFFTYTVRITNLGAEAVQLRRRHWIIRDASGATEEVEGPGVVGAEPLLQPGASFEYTSFCPLRTPTGTMHGTFAMVTSADDRFDAEIAPFLLSEALEFH